MGDHGYGRIIRSVAIVVGRAALFLGFQGFPCGKKYIMEKGTFRKETGETWEERGERMNWRCIVTAGISHIG